MAPSNIQAPNINNDKKLLIPNLESQDGMKLIEYIDNLPKQDNNELYGRIGEQTEHIP